MFREMRYILILLIATSCTLAKNGQYESSLSSTYFIQVSQVYHDYAEGSTYYCLLEGKDFQKTKRAGADALYLVTKSGANVIDTYYLTQGQFDNCCTHGHNRSDSGSDHELAQEAQEYITLLESGVITIDLDPALAWKKELKGKGFDEFVSVWKVNATYCTCVNLYNLTMLQGSVQDSAIYLKTIDVAGALGNEEIKIFKGFW